MAEDIYYTDDFASIRKQCVESINRCTDYVLKYLDGDEKDSKLIELKSYIHGYCSLDEVLTSEDFKGRICEGDGVEEIEDKIAALPPSSKNSNHDYMKDFLENIANQNSSQDEPDLPNISTSQSLEGDGVEDIINQIDDYLKPSENIGNKNSIKDEPELAIISTRPSHRDPITKAKIQTPTQNTVCGHVYDKKSILNHMRAKGKVKCPCVGCSSLVPLSESCLVPYDMPPASNCTSPCNDATIEVSDDDDEDTMEII